MGIESALVDRARVIRQEAAGDRVAGSTRMVPVTGAWFDALLQLPDQPASEDSPGGRRRVVSAPTLLTDVVDEQNEAVEIRNGDRIEVESQRYGRAIWEPSGDPMPLADLYEVLGLQVQVRRVVSHQAAPL